MIQGIRMMEVPPLERTHQESVNNYFCKRNLTWFIAFLVSSISGWCSPVPKKAHYRGWKAVSILNKALIPLLSVRNWGVLNPPGDTSSFTIVMLVWLQCSWCANGPPSNSEHDIATCLLTSEPGRDKTCGVQCTSVPLEGMVEQTEPWVKLFSFGEISVKTLQEQQWFFKLANSRLSWLQIASIILKSAKWWFEIIKRFQCRFSLAESSAN